METGQVTIDEALQSVGEFGRGQARQFLLVSLAWIPGAIQTLVTVFLAQDPVALHWWRCVDPADKACAAVFAQAAPAICALPRDAWEWTRRRRSIISDFDLICQEDWGAQAVNSAYFSAWLIGALLFGTLSDQFGRRRALFAAVLVSFIFGTASALAPSYWWYLALRCLTGFGNSGIGVVAFVLGLEPIGVSKRGIAGILTGCFFTAGACLTAPIAWVVPQWRPLVALAALPMAMYLLLFPAVHESPRWLLVAGRKGEATAALAAIAVGNRTKLPEQPLADSGNSTQVRVTLWDVVQHSRLRVRLAIMTLCWFVVSLAYYGSAFGMGQLAGSIYANHVLIYLIEIPAYVASAAAINRFGRRPTFVYSLMLCGGMTLGCAFTGGWPQRTLAVFGKFGVAIAYNLAYIWTGELFPTTVRNTALGFCSQLGHAGGIVAPAIVFLGTLAGTEMAPFLVFGSAALVSSLLASRLPETLGMATLETLHLMPSKAAASDARPDLLHGQAAPSRRARLSPAGLWERLRHAWRGRASPLSWVRMPVAEDSHD